MLSIHPAETCRIATEKGGKDNGNFNEEHQTSEVPAINKGIDYVRDVEFEEGVTDAGTDSEGEIWSARNRFRRKKIY